LWRISLAVPLAVVPLLASVMASTITWGDGVGNRTWPPTTVAEASAGHGLTLGGATFGLPQPQAPADPQAVIPVEVNVGVGELTIILPAQMSVELDARVGLGSLHVAGQPDVDGVNNSLRLTLPTATLPPAPRIHLVAGLSIGTMEVSR